MALEVWVIHYQGGVKKAQTPKLWLVAQNSKACSGRLWLIVCTMTGVR
jgi:hypothetical protein